jgi:two-component system phosphate regulon response regulator PhoB
MPGKKILIVDDEAPIRAMVAMTLERVEFDLQEAADAAEAERVLAEGVPDLILLDWMMPGISGIEMARRLRRDEYTRDVPIIMLTARGSEDDRIRGLEVGCDDYITKPFSPRELVARIHALLRRSGGVEEGILTVEGLQIDLHSHRVTANGATVAMGLTEFKLLHFFMSHPERVYSRAQVLDRVWGRGAYVDQRTVDVHIGRLRKVLAEHQLEYLVQTVRGMGYRFSAQA